MNRIKNATMSTLFQKYLHRFGVLQCRQSIRFIRTKKALPESTCRYFLRQLAAAVQYMRANDVSHFDLKPQNLLLTRGANNVSLKVADFG